MVTLLTSALLLGLAVTPPAVAVDPSPLEDALDQELERAMRTFRERGQPPYYVSLAVEERETTRVNATAGALERSRTEQGNTLDVELRVGTPALDSTHPLRGMSSLRDEPRRSVDIPLEPPGSYALRHAVWKELDARWRDAIERIVVVRANQSVKVAEELTAPDFELRERVVDRQEVRFQRVDLPAWEDTLRQVSARLDEDPRVQQSQAILNLENLRKTLVDSEGTHVVHGGTWARVAVSVGATAPDGDELSILRMLSFRDVSHLPPTDTLLALADEATATLLQQLQAPRGEPYSGPVLLNGKAAAVFFHEVLGHRVEGQRLKLDSEGKTFLEYVGRPVLPAFIDVVDDPTLPTLGGEDLNGFYAYDDEGVAAQRAVIVDDGVFKGFLMGRSPLPDFPHSNGHGRRSTGKAPSSRMGNTIVEASQTVPRARMRAMLLEEVKRQGLPYGLYVDEIEGGFTMTGRIMPNAFNVRVIDAWRVYADGRPDERIRGVDLVGTPLVAFAGILAAGDDLGVFNGTCGADSGWVPVSAASPTLLLRSMEAQLKEKGEDRPPLLPKPVQRQPEARR
ncbi:MAG: TldD/PmbA family protein [Pseudomonadota bacterium]